MKAIISSHGQPHRPRILIVTLCQDYLVLEDNRAVVAGPSISYSSPLGDAKSIEGMVHNPGNTYHYNVTWFKEIEI